MLVILFGGRNRTISEFISLRTAHAAQSNWRRACLVIALVAAACAASCAKPTDPAPKPTPPPPPFEFLSACGDKGNDPGKLDTPVAFAADSMGRVLFADPGSGFVHTFESNGTPLLSFEDSRVRHASGIAADSGGALYLPETDRARTPTLFPAGTF